MSLQIYPSIQASGSIPRDWKPIRGRSLKYPVRNQRLLGYLRGLATGKWQKVIKDGTSGEVHYFEHSSGRVAGVKFFPRVKPS